MGALELATPHKSTSLFDRFISRRYPGRVYLAVSLLLLSLPFVAAALDGMLEDFLRLGQWRIFLLAPVIILYIWLISPQMAVIGNEVLAVFRSLTMLEVEDFERLMAEIRAVRPGHEMIAISGGILLGLLLASFTDLGDTPLWLRIYWFVTTALMYCLLAWTVYVSIASTREISALQRQPLHIDPLVTTPFEVIGRQGLLLALVFIGGITLSALISFQKQNISSPASWLVYLSLVLLTLAIFFSSMRPTHQVLAAAKKRELSNVQNHLNTACRELTKRLDSKQESGSLPAEIAALSIYEERLQTARTWPYNTTMLRTLFFSIFIPLFTVLARLVMEILF